MFSAYQWSVIATHLGLFPRWKPGKQFIRDTGTDPSSKLTHRDMGLWRVQLPMEFVAFIFIWLSPLEGTIRKRGGLHPRQTSQALPQISIISDTDWKLTWGFNCWSQTNSSPRLLCVWRVRRMCRDNSSEEGKTGEGASEGELGAGRYRREGGALSYSSLWTTPLQN